MSDLLKTLMMIAWRFIAPHAIDGEPDAPEDDEPPEDDGDSGDDDGAQDIGDGGADQRCPACPGSLSLTRPACTCLARPSSWPRRRWWY